jgi:hypothetical protein
MRAFSFLATFMLLSSSLAAQTPITLPSVSRWEVEWHNPEGHYYTAELRLEILKRRSVTGALTWTLRASPRAEELSKIGLSGVERFEGTYDENTGALEFKGVALEDPNTILGMDEYRLTVDSSGRNMTGKTSHGGTWAGEFRAKRIAETGP